MLSRTEQAGGSPSGQFREHICLHSTGGSEQIDRTAPDGTRGRRDHSLTMITTYSGPLAALIRSFPPDELTFLFTKGKRRCP